MTVHGATVDPLTAWANDAVWKRKMGSDADQIRRCLPPELCELHDAVVERARSAAAQALILSGSTVRGRRTESSDLDYHLVGPRIEMKDLSSELDLHVLSEGKLESELLAGDDFVHWSLRFGCVVFDDGTVRRALRLLVERQAWPDVDRKRAHAAKSLELARRFVATGDEDGALEQVRTALSLAARARLLGEGTFPLSRAELPAQLDSIGCGDSARALAATIHASPPLPELAQAVRQGEELLAASRSSTNSAATLKEPQSVADGAVPPR